MNELVGQVESVEPYGEMHGAKMMVLCKDVKHCLREAHGQMFLKTKATKLDMMALGAQLAERKEAVLAAKG